MGKILIVGLATVTLTAAHAQTFVLWDQGDFDAKHTAFADQVFMNPYTDFDCFAVMDVVVPATGWEVDYITVYFTDHGTWVWSQVTRGTANIFPKTGTLPGPRDDPRGSPAVPITITAVGRSLALRNSAELNMVLPAGEYWIGLTPHASFQKMGQEFHMVTVSARRGEETAWRNPGGAFSVGTDWQRAGSAVGAPTGHDFAFKVEGVPEPGTLAVVVAGLAALAKRRRY